MQEKSFPIGVFDSGVGGLTILTELLDQLPAYDFMYLGDNSRAPYGNHDFQTVYKYTYECVEWLFKQGCPLVILACNTASAKALRSIQEQKLPRYYPDKRVLGVIRPTAEIIGNFSKTRHIGVFGTNGTIRSNSYLLEIKKFFPDLAVFQQACPMWVPLIENDEHLSKGADYFVQKYFDQIQEQSTKIDAILLGCTHYPLIYSKLRELIPDHIQLVSQGNIVAQSLVSYLQRHPVMDAQLSKCSKLSLFTTGDKEQFQAHRALYFSKAFSVQEIQIS